MSLHIMYSDERTMLCENCERTITTFNWYCLFYELLIITGNFFRVEKL